MATGQTEDFACRICNGQIATTDTVQRTVCLHNFHKTCLTSWLKKNSLCPECQTDIIAIGHQREGVQTRNQCISGNALEMEQNQFNASQAARQIGQAQVERNLNLLSESFLSRQEETNTNLGSGKIADIQLKRIEDLEKNLMSKIETTLAGIMQQLNLNNNNNNAIPQVNRQESVRPQLERIQQSAPHSLQWQDPINVDNISPLSASGFNRQIDSLRFSDDSIGRNASRIAHLISSWDIKFDGSSKLSVESFIYRIESQVVDVLGGNFNLLCEHIQSILLKDAKDWYWNYRRSVRRVTWPNFCEALRHNFEEHRTDTEIKETIRNRKQGQNETFDEYRHAINKLAERLIIPFPESELVEIMQRGLRPHIRQQLLYVNIRSVTELRRLCLKGESLQKEISKPTAVHTITNRFLPRRTINEVVIDREPEEVGSYESISEVDIEALEKAGLVCWNCRQRVTDTMIVWKIAIYSVMAVVPQTCINPIVSSASRETSK